MPRPWTPEAREEALREGHALPPVKSEGAPRFPIEDPIDLRHAIQDYHTIPTGERPEVRRFITRRAIELDQIHNIPADWHVEKVEDDEDE